MKDWVVCKIFQKDSSKRVDKEERVQESNNNLVPSLSLSSCLTDLDEEREKEEEISSSRERGREDMQPLKERFLNFN
jgi:hypothetical protein